MRTAIFVAACAALAAPAFAQKTEPRKSPDRIAFESICGTCHAVTIIDGFRSFPEWKETVEDMIRYGAKGSDAQFDAVLRYLLRNWTRTNVNTAEAPELEEVLDLTAAEAQAIVDYRKTHGPFRTLDDLKRACTRASAKLDDRKDRIAFE